MNATIASLYIIVGTFDSLVTFIGIFLFFFQGEDKGLYTKSRVGISEYLFFLLAALGTFILRHRENARNRSYRTWTVNPIIFSLFSSLIIVRGIITDPIQGFAVFFLTLVGWVVFKRRFP